MKTKIAYLVIISLAVIVSFAYLSARIEIHYAQQDIAGKRLKAELFKQQMQPLSATAQLSSSFPLQIALLEEHIARQQSYIKRLHWYANHWVLTVMLLLWVSVAALWYQVRKQLGITRQAQAVGWRLWLGRVLFYSGMALILSSVFLPHWQTSDKPELLWILLAGLVLAILGVALRVSRRISS